MRGGEIFGFVGPNGAGKTTTLKILMGLIRADARHARTMLGHDVRETEFRRQVGFLPENPYFYDYLTGREILHFYARLSRRARRRAAPSASTTLLDWVGLAHAGGRAPAHLLEGHAAAHRHRAGARARPRRSCSSTSR